MLLAGSALGASPPQNLSRLPRSHSHSAEWSSAMGPTPRPPPFVEIKNQLRPLPQILGIFSFTGANHMRS